MTLSFKEITEARYNEMLDVLPPLAWCDKGFLVGEAWRHSAEGQPMFAPFVVYNARFYEGSEPITIADWRKLDPRPSLPNRPHDISDLWSKPHEIGCDWNRSKACSCGQPQAL